MPRFWQLDAGLVEHKELRLRWKGASSTYRRAHTRLYAFDVRENVDHVHRTTTAA